MWIKFCSDKILAKFSQYSSLFATIPAMLSYPEFTDRYSLWYGRLSFSLHFMTNTLFFNLAFPTSMSLLHYMAGPIPCMPLFLTPLTEF